MKQKNKYEEFIEICKVLVDNGVKLKRIKLTKRINGKVYFLKLKDVKQAGIDIDKIIKENNLDPDYELSKLISDFRGMYYGSKECLVSCSLLEEGEELGVVTKESLIEETINIGKILVNNGVNLKNVNFTKQGKNGKIIFILLKDIKQDGIDINKIIEDNNLDKNYDIGQRVIEARKIYSGSRGNGLTKPEKTALENLGIVKKESLIQETIRVCRVLTDYDININDIPLKIKNEEGKKVWTKLSDLKQFEIDIDRICEENDLDNYFVIGLRISKARSIYRGIDERKITKSEKEAMEEIGLVKTVLSYEDIQKITKEKEGKKKIKQICKCFNITHNDMLELMKDKNISLEDISTDYEKRDTLIKGIIDISNNKSKEDINNNEKEDKLYE